MTGNDAQIAREWAERAMNLDMLDDVPRYGYRAAARHILASTPAPTMADIAWDDEVHAGLCAEHPEHGPVRMTRLDTEGDIWFLTDLLKHHFSRPADLTPLPGTRLDLTPRRHAEGWEA